MHSFIHIHVLIMHSFIHSFSGAHKVDGTWSLAERPLLDSGWCVVIWHRAVGNRSPSVRYWVPPPPPLHRTRGYLCSFLITWTPLSRGKGYPKIYPLSRVLVTVGNYKNTPFSWFSRGNLPETTAKNTPFPEKMGTPRMRPPPPPPYAFGVGGGTGCWWTVAPCSQIYKYINE